MATIVVLDDDPATLARGRKLVEECLPADPQLALLEAHGVDELEAILAEGTHVDILVTDIMMGEGQPTAIDAVQRLFPASSGTQVIYVSGILEQATEVYRTNHVYFLLKPVDTQKLQEALRRAYDALPAAHPAMLRIKVGHKEHLLNAATISYLESVLHKVQVHCGSRTYETYARLDELQEQLPASFSRCHRSFLVNLAHVTQLNHNEVLMYDGTTIPVSRRRARQVERDLLHYLASQNEN